MASNGTFPGTGFAEMYGRVRKFVSKFLYGTRAGFGTSGGGWLRILLPQAKKDYARLIREPYRSVSAFVPLLFLARNACKPDLVVTYRKGSKKGEPIDEHPLVQLLDRPNPFMNYADLIKFTVIQSSTGVAYWIKVRNAVGGVVQLVPVPSWTVQPVSYSDTEQFTHFRYTAAGVIQEFPRSEVVYFRDGQDPDNPMLGLSELGYLAREIFVDNSVSTMRAALAENLGIPGLMITPEDPAQPIPPDDIEQIRNDVWERTTGDNRGKPLVLRGAVKVEKITWDFRQMDLASWGNVPAERVCAAIGVSAMACGLPSASKTYANYEEALRSAWHEGILPRLEWIAETLYHQLLPDIGDPETERVEFDTTNIPALKESEDAKVDRACKMLTSGLVSRAVAKKMIGEEVDENDEIYYVPNNVTVLTADHERVVEEPMLTTAALPGVIDDATARMAEVGPAGDGATPEEAAAAKTPAGSKPEGDSKPTDPGTGEEDDEDGEARGVKATAKSKGGYWITVFGHDGHAHHIFIRGAKQGGGHHHFDVKKVEHAHDKLHQAHEAATGANPPHPHEIESGVHGAFRGLTPHEATELARSYGVHNGHSLLSTNAAARAAAKKTLSAHDSAVRVQEITGRPPTPAPRPTYRPSAELKEGPPAPKATAPKASRPERPAARPAESRPERSVVSHDEGKVKQAHERLQALHRSALEAGGTFPSHEPIHAAFRGLSAGEAAEVGRRFGVHAGASTPSRQKMAEAATTKVQEAYNMADRLRDILATKADTRHGKAGHWITHEGRHYFIAGAASDKVHAAAGAILAKHKKARAAMLRRQGKEHAQLTKQQARERRDARASHRFQAKVNGTHRAPRGSDVRKRQADRTRAHRRVLREAHPREREQLVMRHAEERAEHNERVREAIGKVRAGQQAHVRRREEAIEAVRRQRDANVAAGKAIVETHGPNIVHAGHDRADGHTIEAGMLTKEERAAARELWDAHAGDLAGLMDAVMTEG